MTRTFPLRRLASALFALLATVFATSLATSLPVGAETLLHQDHPLVGRIWDPKSRSPIDEATLLGRIARADVLLLGETHDNPVHHRIQLQLLQARVDAGARPALLMEQFDVERQAALDAVLAGDSRELALDLATALGKGWDWALYRPLLAIAFDRKLPVIAANFSRERLRPVIRQGFAAFDAGERQRLAVDAVWSESRQQYLTGIMEKSHCGKINADLRDGLVKGQRLRDAVMADAAVAAMLAGPTADPANPANLANPREIVGIVGRGHARRDVGIPLYLAARAPATRVVAIGLIEVSPELTSPEAYEAERPADLDAYDLLWFTPRAERPDPCASFGK